MVTMRVNGYFERYWFIVLLGRIDIWLLLLVLLERIVTGVLIFAGICLWALVLLLPLI